MVEVTNEELLAEYRKGFKEGYKAGYHDANLIVQNDPESKWRHP